MPPRLARILLLLAFADPFVRPAQAQPALLDSLRPITEHAIVRADWVALDSVLARLRNAARTGGAQHAWTHYDLGYALHRRASVLLIAKQLDAAEPLLAESVQALERAESLGAGAAARGLRGAVTGQLAGASGMFAAMRLGPRAWDLLDSAITAAPDDPRIALVNGMSRLNAPRMFGGGTERGERELRRAVALFANDTARFPAPTWGRVDAHIWLGIALHQLGRDADARAELEAALRLAPAHAWVERELLPQLARRRQER